MIYDDFSKPGWPREKWVEYRYPHVDLWDPATIATVADGVLTVDLKTYTVSHPNHVKARIISSLRLYDSKPALSR